MSTETVSQWERQTLGGVLQQVTKLGIQINTVIDVGAAHGWWSINCAETLPNARYLLLEPLEEYRKQLEASTAKIGNAEYQLVGLDGERGSREIHVHPDLVGSSFYLEDEDGDVNGVPRVVPIETIDGLVAERELVPPYLIKIDVQGAELDVLSGARRTLSKTEFAILESSFFRIYENETTVLEIVDAMREFGFVPYDLFGLAYRPLDGALSQVDICFVRADGPFREHHHYATLEQRKRQTRRLRQMNANAGPQTTT